jgi:hypothetical protein
MYPMVIQHGGLRQAEIPAKPPEFPLEPREIENVLGNTR